MKLTNKHKEFIRWYVATDISAEMFERIGDYKELQDDKGEVPDEVWEYINSLGDRVYAFFNYPTRDLVDNPFINSWLIKNATNLSTTTHGDV